MSLTFNAQKDITPLVSKALQQGDSETLSKHFIQKVDLTLLDDEDIYSREEANKKLSQFFQTNGTISFSIKHKGTSKLDDQYRIGDLITKTGKFRVTFFIKRGDKGMQINQFRIEEIDDDF